MDKMDHLIGHPRELNDAVLPARDYPLCHENLTMNPLLTKFFPSRWLDAGLVRFMRFVGLGLRVCVIKTPKKNEANVQPSYLNAW